MEYTLKRSHRKTMAIHITKEAKVEVRVPLKMPQREIDRFVDSKQEWIHEHVLERERMNEQKEHFQLRYGDTVMLQGREYPIIAKEGNRVGFDGEGFFVPPDLPSEDVKRAVVLIYRMTAKRLLTNKVMEYANKMRLVPTAVHITGAKTRWGSCSSKNSVNFSWRLCMANDEVMDYVVVHELAHIKEHNHSDRFWAIVEETMPDYKVRQAGLRDLQKRLSEEEWD